MRTLYTNVQSSFLIQIKLASTAAAVVAAVVVIVASAA